MEAGRSVRGVEAEDVQDGVGVVDPVEFIDDRRVGAGGRHKEGAAFGADDVDERLQAIRVDLLGGEHGRLVEIERRLELVLGDVPADGVARCLQVLDDGESGRGERLGALEGLKDRTIDAEDVVGDVGRHAQEVLVVRIVVDANRDDRLGVADVRHAENVSGSEDKGRRCEQTDSAIHVSLFHLC